MKKFVLIILNAILACLCFMPNWLVANAEGAFSLKFALTANNGRSVVYAEQNEVITVSFVMQRTDSNENYTTNGFQNYIRYDSSFFEYVENSIVCMDTGSATAKLDNSLTYGKIIQCQNMGKTYEANFVFCIFQLKVLAEDGSSVVSNINDEIYAFDSTFQKVTVTTQDLTVNVTDCSHQNATTVAAKEPTCTEIGWDSYEKCDECGYTTYVEKAALGHDKVQNGAKAPTCTEIGWDAYETCTRCNYTTYVEKAALGHDKVLHSAKTPTCTEIGWDAYETCTRCSHTTYVEKAALGHNAEGVVAHKDASCTETGIVGGTYCTRCNEGKAKAEEVIAALGHAKVQHSAQAPSCMAIGWDAYETCSRCNYTTYVEKAALGHDKVLHKAKAVTCTEDGWSAYYSCSICGLLFDETGANQISRIPYIAGGHNFSKEAAYDENGHWYECTLCDEISGYAAHSGKKADCKSKAKCDVCAHEYGEIDAHNHTGEKRVENEKDPLPWQDGYSGDVYCSNCEELLEEGETISQWSILDWPWKVVVACFLLLLFGLLLIAMMLCLII